MNFSKEIIDGINDLRLVYGGEGGSKNDYVAVSYPVIEIIKMYLDKKLHVKLIYDSMDNTFEIQEPAYQYYSKISHYDYRRTETRWIRDKKFLFSLINNLKKCGLWEMVSNKDFIAVNEFQDKAKAKELLKILKELKKV